MAGGPRGRKFSGVKIQISNIEQIHGFRRLNINSWRCYYLILRQKFIFSLVSNHSIGPGRPEAWERSLGSRAGPDGQVMVAWWGSYTERKWVGESGSSLGWGGQGSGGLGEVEGQGARGSQGGQGGAGAQHPGAPPSSHGRRLGPATSG